LVSLLDDVIQLLNLGIGDRGRLEHIKDSIEKNKPLYSSDKTYLENKIKQYLQNPEVKKIKELTDKETAIKEKTSKKFQEQEIEFIPSVSKEELDREYEQSKQDRFEEIMNSGTSFEFEDDENKPKPDYIGTFEKKEPNQPSKCSFQDCDVQVDFFSGKNCKFCQNPYCFKHIQLEKHECSKTTPVKFLRKSWLRKYGVNISSGRYIVVCDVCGYVSEIGSLIDIAGEERTYHINTSGCDEKKVFLEEDLSHEKISKNINLEEIVPSDRMFWVCSHCRPPQKFTNRSEYIAHHYSHN
jgi:hypothetical protein